MPILSPTLISRKEALEFTVLGDIAYTVADGVAGIMDSDALSVQIDLAGCFVVHTEDHPR